MYKPDDYKIEIYFSEDDNCYIARAPELDGCYTDGDTKEEALERIGEAVKLWLKSAKANKRPIPIPFSKNKFSGKIALRIDPDLHKRAAIAAQSSGDSVNKFIEKTLKKFVV